MEIKNKIDYCGNCKTYSQFHFGTENYNPLKYDLESYKNYKDIYVYRCPTCGNISVDISNLSDAKIFSEQKNSEKFLDILDYGYLDGLDLELFENHTTSVPANLYEIYAEIQKEQNNFEQYFRAMNKSIELKEMIIQKYAVSVEEDNDSEDYDILNDLSELMYDNIYEKREELCNTFSKLDKPNLFVCLIFIENLAKLGNISEAKEYFKALQTNYNLEEDLVINIREILKENN